MTIAGLLSLVALTLAGVPIFLAMIIAAIIIMVIGMGTDPILQLYMIFNNLNTLQLLAVPLFLLMGHILAIGGAGPPLVRVMNAFMGHMRGGVAYAVIVANVMVAAMCSSPIAGIAAFGPLMIPLMTKLGYSEKFAYGLVICSACLEPLIPPSLITIFYSYIVGPYAEGESVSVITLWTGSIIPGLLLAALLAATVYIHTRRGHFERLPRATWTERWQALKKGWAVLLMPVVVLAPLYMGWTNPTESAAIGTLYVVLISIFVYRGLTPKVFWTASVSTLRVIGTVFAIVMGALLIGKAVTLANVPQDISIWLGDLGLDWWMLIFLLMIAFIIMGMFLDPTAIILLSVPLLVASVLDANISLIAFGIFATLAVNLANITPPYGLVIFATMGVLNKPYGFIVRSIFLFIPAMVIGLLLVAFFPGLCTWLPAVTGK
ncbi:TRAP transporter large permease [Chloroflexota bacterium]